MAARGFIDLLDAQSEIKPSGFQSRVKASGVRDYGEDVADRNIGENGGSGILRINEHSASPIYGGVRVNFGEGLSYGQA
ncbi:hypothetical protein ColKHC_03167 [Colletotrichum higginsianum]|nr:hypothetical protein ColKHC_03167 [Colletotrichum higginsianum]